MKLLLFSLIVMVAAFTGSMVGSLLVHHLWIPGPAPQTLVNMLMGGVGAEACLVLLVVAWPGDDGEGDGE